MSEPNPTVSESERPTMVRFGVLAFLCVLAFILYVDRVCIGQAATFMKAELDISNTKWGFVLGAFTLAYTLFEVPTGHWGDKYGSRGVLLRIVMWWSIFTALTGCVWKMTASTPSWGWFPALSFSFLLLMLIRFLFGVGEAGAFPNICKVIGDWFPDAARGRAQGAITTASLIGGAAAPIGASYLIQNLGWRWTFGVFGLLGIVWCAVFAMWFRDRPQEHPACNKAEQDLITRGRAASAKEHGEHAPVPWGRVLTSANLWLMALIINCGAAMFYMIFSWYATYLKTARMVPETESGWMTSMVMAGGAIGCMTGGIVNDLLVKFTGERRTSRRIIGISSALLSATAVLFAIQMESPLATSIFMSIAFFGVQLPMPAWWGIATEISGRHVGALFGLMNSLGVGGALGSPLLLGALTDYLKAQGAVGRAQWDPGFYVYSGLMLIAAMVWCLIDPNKSLVEAPPPEPETLSFKE